MVRSYLKFDQAAAFGVVTATTANTLWTSGDDDALAGPARKTSAGCAVVGANEDVLCWNLKTSDLVSRWHDVSNTATVTAIRRSPSNADIYAVGYGDGTIRLWDARTATVVMKFDGHKNGVTALAFDHSGDRLASGAHDTDIIIWDLIAETGLFRLRGHKNQLTGLCFLRPQQRADTDINGEEVQSQGALVEEPSEPRNFLLSCSKEAVLKLWDLESQHCLETHVTQSNGECWAMSVAPRQDGCITAGNEGELKIWNIDPNALQRAAIELERTADEPILRQRGSLYRHGKDKTIGVQFHPRLGYIAAHGADKAIEIWRLRSQSEVQKALARKRKRRREKAGLSDADGPLPAEEESKDKDLSQVDIAEMISSHTIVRTAGRVRSFDWSAPQSRSLQLVVSTTSNQIELYEVQTAAKKAGTKAEQLPDYRQTLNVDLPGHRTDIRALALSSDDRMLASAANGSLKIWNVRTQTCIRSLECGYALCCAFLPGDKIVVVGTRKGELELFDIAASVLLDTVAAHDGPTWTLHIHPDGNSMVTGSADKTAKTWTFDIEQEEIPGTRRTTPRLRLVHRRTLKLNDDVLSIRFSPDGRLLALSLLDNTVRIFFVDSFKQFLNLYGHKLPVLSLDISYDSKLIVTCSADKNVRIWGLDFGDCHKALFAHQDSVMQVAFVPHNHEGNGHYFFSAGKDRLVKYWDGDKFEQIQKLAGHHGEIWALAVSRIGAFVVSASHDKSIRVWKQTDEQIFLEEEREKEMEELYDSTLAANLDEDDIVDGQVAELAPAGKQTSETLTAGERIAEALEVGSEDLRILEEWQRQKALQPDLPAPQRDIRFLAYGNISAEAHVLSVVEKVPAASLHDALLVLTFDRVTTLLVFLRLWAERQWNISLTCRILFFLLRTHHRQIIASKTMRPMLDEIRAELRRALQQQKNEMGLNLAALKVLSESARDQSSTTFVDEQLWDQDGQAADRKKRAFLNVA